METSKPKKPAVLQKATKMVCHIEKAIFIVVCILLVVVAVSPQSRRSMRGDQMTGLILAVTVNRDPAAKAPIKIDDLFLYEGGIEQKIRNFSSDPSPSRIVILVDNSQTLQTSVEVMRKAALEFAYEIFEGDQIFVIAYDEKPEIIQEWTDDASKMEASFEVFRKKGNPYLFDSINVTLKEILVPLMPGTQKTAVVLISDGLDRGSKVSFENVLSELQRYNVVVYGLQLPDRTGGAYRRDQPRAKTVMERLAEETGGKNFPFSEAETAAKVICDELRKNRYLLSYVSSNPISFDPRRILLIGNEGIEFRLKSSQPPTIK